MQIYSVCVHVYRTNFQDRLDNILHAVPIDTLELLWGKTHGNDVGFDIWNGCGQGMAVCYYIAYIIMCTFTHVHVYTCTCIHMYIIYMYIIIVYKHCNGYHGNTCTPTIIQADSGSYGNKYIKKTSHPRLATNDKKGSVLDFSLYKGRKSCLKWQKKYLQNQLPCVYVQTRQMYIRVHVFTFMKPANIPYSHMTAPVVNKLHHWHWGLMFEPHKEHDCLFWEHWSSCKPDLLRYLVQLLM